MTIKKDPTNSTQDSFLDNHDMLKAGLTNPAGVVWMLRVTAMLSNHGANPIP